MGTLYLSEERLSIWCGWARPDGPRNLYILGEHLAEIGTFRAKPGNIAPLDTSRRSVPNRRWAQIAETERIVLT